MEIHVAAIDRCYEKNKQEWMIPRHNIKIDIFNTDIQIMQQFHN